MPERLIPANSAADLRDADEDRLGERQGFEATSGFGVHVLRVGGGEGAHARAAADPLAREQDQAVQGEERGRRERLREHDA